MFKQWYPLNQTFSGYRRHLPTLLNFILEMFLVYCCCVWLHLDTITPWHLIHMVYTCQDSLILSRLPHFRIRMHPRSRGLQGGIEWAEIAWFNMSSTCSKALKSWKLASLSIFLIITFLSHWSTILTLARHALSSTRMISGPVAPAFGPKLEPRILFWYLSAVSDALFVT